MNSKRTYIATFWRGNLQLKNGGYYMTKEFQAVSHKAAERQAETLSIVFGPMMSRNKSIKCESFMTCCRLNLSGLQENKLMNMQQEWA